MIQTLNDWSLFLNGSTVVVGRKYQLASSRKYESTKGTKMLDVLLDLGQVRSGQDNMSTCQQKNRTTKATATPTSKRNNKPNAVQKTSIKKVKNNVQFRRE